MGNFKKGMTNLNLNSKLVQEVMTFIKKFNYSIFERIGMSLSFHTLKVRGIANGRRLASRFIHGLIFPK
jgi:hypothetical protein